MLVSIRSETLTACQSDQLCCTLFVKQSKSSFQGRWINLNRNQAPCDCGNLVRFWLTWTNSLSGLVTFQQLMSGSSWRITRHAWIMLHPQASQWLLISVYGSLVLRVFYLQSASSQRTYLAKVIWKRERMKKNILGGGSLGCFSLMWFLAVRVCNDAIIPAKRTTAKSNFKNWEKHEFPVLFWYQIQSFTEMFIRKTLHRPQTAL